MYICLQLRQILCMCLMRSGNIHHGNIHHYPFTLKTADSYLYNGEYFHIIRTFYNFPFLSYKHG